MAKRPGEFSASTKKAIALRVGYLCSNPKCRCLTTGPIASDPKKAYSIGQAAHIYGIGNQARHEPDIDPKDLAEPSNGIWLCTTHHTMIDRDEKTYSVSLLKAWKEEAEYYATNEMGRVPELKRTFLANQDFFFRELKRDIDDRLYFAGFKISYDAFFLYERNILWVKPKIDCEPDYNTDLEDMLCLATEHTFLNEIDFVMASKAVCILDSGKLYPKTFQKPNEGFQKFLENINFEFLSHLTNHPIEIFSGFVRGQFKTVIFDIDAFSTGQAYKSL